MDPNANLAEQLRLAQEIRDALYETEITERAERLAELVETLNEWIKRGGFLPSAWEHAS